MSYLGLRWPKGLEGIAFDGLWRLRGHFHYNNRTDVSYHDIARWGWFITDSEILAVRGIGRKRLMAIREWQRINKWVNEAPPLGRPRMPNEQVVTPQDGVRRVISRNWRDRRSDWPAAQIETAKPRFRVKAPSQKVDESLTRARTPAREATPKESGA